MRTLAILALGLAVVGVGAGCGGAEQARLPHGRSVSLATSLTPLAHLFAEPVTARADVFLDTRRLDPARIRVTTSFAPYEVLRVTRQRSDFDGLTRFRYLWTIRCLLIQCIPSVLPSAAGPQESGRGDRVSFQFAPVRALYRDPKGATRVVAAGRWPRLESVSRLNSTNIPGQGFVFKTHVLPLPPATYRISPTLLAILLLSAAALLLALPATLAVRWWKRRQPPPVEEAPPVPPLELAAQLVEWAAETDGAGPGHREALEKLAFELDASGGTELASEARGLAWAPASPSLPATEELVDAVRRSNGLAA